MKPGPENRTSVYELLSYPPMAFEVQRNWTLGAAIPPTTPYSELAYRFNLAGRAEPPRVVLGGVSVYLVPENAGRIPTRVNNSNDVDNFFVGLWLPENAREHADARIYDGMDAAEVGLRLGPELKPPSLISNFRINPGEFIAGFYNLQANEGWHHMRIEVDSNVQ